MWHSLVLFPEDSESQDVFWFEVVIVCNLFHGLTAFEALENLIGGHTGVLKEGNTAHLAWDYFDEIATCPVHNPIVGARV